LLTRAPATKVARTTVRPNVIVAKRILRAEVVMN
jgi:hypothetical protein